MSHIPEKKSLSATNVMPRLTNAATPAPNVRNMRTSLKGAFASLRSSTSPALETPPLMFSVASSHSLRSRNCLKSGSCSVLCYCSIPDVIRNVPCCLELCAGHGWSTCGFCTFSTTEYLRPYSLQAFVIASAAPCHCLSLARQQAELYKAALASSLFGLRLRPS